MTPAAPPPPPVRYARRGDISLAYTVFGDGPVDAVLVPGLLCHLDVERERPEYVGFLNRLARRARLVVYDKRGMGLSDRFAGPATLEERVEDLLAVLDAAGAESPVLLGYSEGGLLAARLAADAPERVRGVAMMSSCPRFRRTEDYPYGFTDARAEAQLFGYVDTAWGSGLWGRLVVPSRAEDVEFVRWFGRFERTATSPGTMRQLLEMDRHVDVREAVATLRVPLLVVHRTGDRILSVEHARQLAQLAPDARLVELPGSEHPPWEGDAESYAAAVEDFLGELASR